jgi:hypothetical protein
VFDEVPDPDGLAAGGGRCVSRDEIGNYDLACIVAGTRGFEDRAVFDCGMALNVQPWQDAGLRIVFITGKAKTGADKLIIDWCREKGYDWIEVPADWNKYEGSRGKNPAGHIRNEEMAKLVVQCKRYRLIAFWDPPSTGTENMIKNAIKYRIHYSVIFCDAIPMEERTWRVTARQRPPRS